MAAKNIVFALYSGAEFTMQLFRKSAPDTLVATSSSVTHGISFPELHTAIFSDVPEDDYLARIFDADDNVSYELVTIGPSTTNFVESLRSVATDADAAKTSAAANTAAIAGLLAEVRKVPRGSTAKDGGAQFTRTKASATITQLTESIE